MSKPIIFKEGEYSEDDLRSFCSKVKPFKVIDLYDEQLKEYKHISEPSTSSYKKMELQQLIIDKSDITGKTAGTWVFFPWNKMLAHILEEKSFFTLRTNRNQYIITEQEQLYLNDLVVGFAGLSVGQHYAIALAQSGISNQMKLADFDHLATSNLNRVSASIMDLHKKKVDVVAEQIYELNPYANLDLFTQGLTDSNLVEFINGASRLSVIFEAMDDLKMKIKLRLAAKHSRIPLIMLTNVGDRILVDIERYDLNPNLPLFNGILGNLPTEILETELNNEKNKEFIMKIVGKENISKRVLNSLRDVGSKLIGRPQIYSTVAISGGLASYLVREIFLNNQLSGRCVISLPEIINIKS